MGQVEKVDVATDGAVVTVDIENQNNHIPKQVRAEVQKLSAVGEQYIDLLPQTRSPPYLKDGDIIPYSMTSTPVDENTVLVHANELVRTDPQGRPGHDLSTSSARHSTASVPTCSGSSTAATRSSRPSRATCRRRSG